MKAERLHLLVAYLAARLTYRRMAERHYYGGLSYAANDDGIL